MALLGVDLLNKTAFETLLGRSADHVRIFAQTQTPPGSQWTPVTTYINAGYQVMVSWKPTGTWANVASGGEDARIDAIGAFLHAQSNTPARQNYYTFHHEPENDAFGTAADYRAAMARVLSRIGAITPTSRWAGGVCYKSSTMAGMPNHTGEDPDEWFVAAPIMYVDLYNYMGTNTGPWATPEAGNPGSTTYLNTHPRDIEDFQAWMDFGASHGVTRFAIPEFGSALHNVPPVDFAERVAWLQAFSNRYQGIPELEFVDYYNQGQDTGFTEQRLTANSNYADDTAAMAAFADLETPVAGMGWGDGAWGDLYWDGQRAGATYLSGTTTLPAGTTTWTTEHVVPIGSTLIFPAASSTTLVMDNKNLIVYGTLEMHPASFSQVHLLQFTNVDEEAYVGGAFPDGTIDTTPMATDVGLWIVGTGVLDAVGTPKAAWNRTGDDSTWLSTDEMKTTPWTALNYTTYNTHTKGGALATVTAGNGVTYTQECFNLTRNVRFEGTSGHRAHAIIMTPNVTQVVKHCAFRYMGPRQVSSPGQTRDVRDRLGGLHLQHLLDSPDTLIEGVVVRDAGNHAFDCTDSHNVTFRDCIAYSTVDHQYTWSEENEEENVEHSPMAPGQFSHGVTYDHCMAAAAQLDNPGAGARLAGFRLLAQGGTVSDCVAVGNRGKDKATGFYWIEDNGAPWDNSDNVSHNNSASGAYIYQSTFQLNEVINMVCFRNGQGGISNGYSTNFHFSGCVAFENAGSGDTSTDFIDFPNERLSAPSYHQVIQDCWFGDVGVHWAHTGSTGAGVWRNNHLGSIRINEDRPGASENNRDYDFVENDLQEPEQFCDLAHPHAGSHHLVWMYPSHFPDGVASQYRIQRTDGTAWQIQLDAGSASDWNPVTIPGFAFAIPAQTLSMAVQGVSYSHALTKTFGGSSIIWALAPTSGPLPTGLSLSPTGVISGTPTIGGSFPIIVQAVDESTERARRSLTLTVQGDATMAGWGDSGWGDLYWDGQIAGATYLPGTTVLPAGTTTWNTNTVIPYGSTLRFPPSSTTTLIMDNKNLIVYGTMEMNPANPSIIHTWRAINVVEANYVGAPFPDGGMGSMAPKLTDVGLWVLDQGIADWVGSPRAGWKRTGDDPTWLSTDEMKTTPFDALDYTTYATHVKGGTLKTVSPGNGQTYVQEAFNLTRNVRFEGLPGKRTHVLIMTPGVGQTIKYCSFQWTGPRQPLAQGRSLKIRGRWSGIHLHHLMEGGYDTLIEGVVVRDGGSHAFVAHDSDGVVFRDCIAYKVQEDNYWWDQETAGDIPGGDGRGELVTGQASQDVLYDHCMSAGVHMPASEGDAHLSGFMMGCCSDTITDCVAVGNTGTSVAAGITWPESAGGIWLNSNNVVHNNTQRGVYIWQNTQSHHELFGMVAFRNGAGGIQNGAYGNNYHHFDSVCFQNAGSGDESVDFIASAAGATFAPPNYQQIIQGCWFGDFGITHHVGSGTAGDPAIVRDNHLGSVRINEFRVSGQFKHSEFDFIRNDCEEPEDFCELTHPHAGNHQAVYLYNGTQFDPTPSTMRIQRADGTAWKMQQVGASTTEWTAVSIAPFDVGIVGTGAFAARAAAFAGTGTESGIPGIGNYKPAKPAFAGVGTHQISVTGSGAVAAARAALDGSGSTGEAITIGRIEGAAAAFAGEGTASDVVISAPGSAPFRVGSRRYGSRLRSRSTSIVVRGSGGPVQRAPFRVRGRHAVGRLRGVNFSSSLRSPGVGEPIVASGAFAAAAPSFAGLGASGDVTGIGTLAAAAASFEGTGTGSAITGTGTFAAPNAVLAGIGAESNAAFGNITGAAASFAAVGNSQATGAGAFGASVAAFAGTASETITGAGNLAASAASFAGVGEVPTWTGAGDFAAAAAVLDGEGIFIPLDEINGLGDFLATPAELAGVGEQTSPPVTGSGGITGAVAALEGIGVYSIEGTGAFLAEAAEWVGIGLLNSITGTGDFVGAGASFGGAVQIAGNFDYDMAGPYPKWRFSLKTRSG